MGAGREDSEGQEHRSRHPAPDHPERESAQQKIRQGRRRDRPGRIAQHTAEHEDDSEHQHLAPGRVAIWVDELRSSAQSEAAAKVDEARLAARSVSLDEEMVDLVAAQRAYEASARVVSAIDQMLDTLVNRLGTVGR